MSTGYSKTSWPRIERDYDDVITEIRNSPNSEPGLVEKTIIFDDFNRLKCRERISDGVIEFFQYDFYDSSGNVIIKYHSEPHSDPAYQTETEPFHMHIKKDKDDLAASVRIPLPVPLRTVDGILEHIIHSRYIKYVHIE